MHTSRPSYPVASTSYHQHLPTANHPDFTHDIYIPESQQELSRLGVESRLLQPSGPTHLSDMRATDHTAASSSFDTYDRIGREDDFPSARRPSNARHSKVAHHFDPDESLIPGVGRGVRSTVPAQTSYHERLRSLHANTSDPRTQSSPARSPYRPGKYSSRYAPSQSTQPIPSSSHLRTASSPARVASQARMPRVESASESDADSVSESGESDAHDLPTATYNSTGNHRNFAATPAGHTVTMTANLHHRPRLGQDTLDRIEFDLHTDTDSEHRARRPHPSVKHLQPSVPQQTARERRADPTRPFASPRAATTNTFGMNAADYQQHLASRTLTSPAIRTLIGDRSKSPDSPTPAPSIDGVLHAGKHRARDADRPQPRATRQNSVSAVSAFEDLARQLQRDVEITRRPDRVRHDDADDASVSNSGGSGFGPGSQASSARTRVDSDAGRDRRKPFEPTHFNVHGFPALHKGAAAAAAETTAPWGVRLPDVTGLTSALGSPVKARDAVQHRPFDAAVGNQDARLEELANLRGFVDGIQTELDRAGERILNLEQAHEQQSHDFQGLRSEMQSALHSVRAAQPSNDEALVQRILQQLRVASQEQTAQPAPQEPRAQPQPEAAPQLDTARVARGVQADPVQTGEREARVEGSQVEVVNRLYAELEQLRTVMEQQYRRAAGLASDDEAAPAARREQHAAYRHRDQWPSGRDPWEAIEALRIQVLSLASEVEGLNGLVRTRLSAPNGPSASSSRRQMRSEGARHRMDAHWEAEVHAASDPGLPIREGRYARSSTPARAHTDEEFDEPASSRRGVSFGPGRVGESDDDVDRTLDAIAENVRVQRERRRRAATVEEAEISQLASVRAERASARVGGRPHDARTCTVCASSARSERRKASRRARLLAAEQRRDDAEVEESLLLAQGSVGEHGRAVLDRVLQQHWDEFVHQRMLYAELADELKLMDPHMSKPKRDLLARHVLEAVEALELKADRINTLEDLLKRTTANKPRNGLKHALDAVESSKHSERPENNPRNSPPTTLRL